MTDLTQYKTFDNCTPYVGAQWCPGIVGFVYVIGFEEAEIVKIGSANCPVLRLEELQCGNPFELRLLAAVATYDVPAVEIEFAAHRLARDFHIRGEWFDLPIDEAIGAILKAARNKKARIGSSYEAAQKWQSDHECAIAAEEEERRRKLRIKLGMDA